MHARLDVLDDLQADGALAGDDGRVVERRHHGEPLDPRDLRHAAVPLGRRHQDDLRPERPDRLDLARGGHVRHDHDAADPEVAGRPGHRLAVVAGRVGHARRPRGRRGQAGQRVHRAADLERAHRLQVLRLEPEPGPVGRPDHRRADGHAGRCGRRPGGHRPQWSDRISPPFLDDEPDADRRLGAVVAVRVGGARLERDGVARRQPQLLEAEGQGQLAAEQEAVLAAGWRISRRRRWTTCCPAGR